MTRLEQPRLFQFIDEICARVGAPKPVQVRIDNQVNASASFEHGWWGVITGRLVLTIGLPLPQGLTVGQFGGVLAHEFGHFTQAAAMRFSYAIRSTNDWFSRLIFERDSFDAKLLAWSKRGTYYTILIANIARGFVWLARKILWLLMRAGHAVSAYLMRQMEYHADHYELEVAGAENFRETFVRLQLANAGAQMTGQHLQQLWKTGRLVNNAPLLTQRLTATVSADAVEKWRASLNEKKTAPWHATHPSDPERIARSAHRAGSGILSGDAPATIIFDRFETLARELTLIDYRERFRLDVKPEMLVPTDAYLQENSVRGDRVKALSEFLGGLIQDDRLLFPQPPAESLPTIYAERHAHFRACAAVLEAAQPAAQKLNQEIEALRDQRARVHYAQALELMGLQPNASNLGLTDVTPSGLKATVRTLDSQIEVKRLEQFPDIRLAQEKLHIYLSLIECPDAVAAIMGDLELAATLERVVALKKALLATAPIFDLLTDARKSFCLASIYVQMYQAAKNKARTNVEFEAYTIEFEDINQRIERVANGVPYLLRDGMTHSSLTAYFRYGHATLDKSGQFAYLRSIYERYTHFYTEIMLELLEKVAAVEQACANELVAQG